MQAQAEHEAAKIREKVEQKQRERVAQQQIDLSAQEEKKKKQVSPPRKKWEEHPSEPVLAVKSGEQTSRLNEGERERERE